MGEGGRPYCLEKDVPLAGRQARLAAATAHAEAECWEIASFGTGPLSPAYAMVRYSDQYRNYLRRPVDTVTGARCRARSLRQQAEEFPKGSWFPGGLPGASGTQVRVLEKILLQNRELTGRQRCYQRRLDAEADRAKSGREPVSGRQGLEVGRFNYANCLGKLGRPGEIVALQLCAAGRSEYL